VLGAAAARTQAPTAHATAGLILGGTGTAITRRPSARGLGRASVVGHGAAVAQKPTALASQGAPRLPVERIIVALAEYRAITVVATSRTMVLPAIDRGLVAPAASRVLVLLPGPGEPPGGFSFGSSGFGTGQF
jgi:hypothetical protein